jgi:hypothetical protein
MGSVSDPSLDVAESTRPGLATLVESTAARSVGTGRRSIRSVGSGLRPWELGAILVISTTAFLFWGGPLWDVPVGTSHVGRIGGSYLVVIPLVLAALARSHRASVGHFLGAVGILWSAKMVITATLYAYVAPESATQYAPARTWEGPREPAPADRGGQPVTGTVTDVGSGDVAGVVVANDGPEHFPVAAVIVEDLPESPFAGPPVNLSVSIEHAHYRQSVYLAGSQDRLVLTNADASLHTLRVTEDRRAIANIPVPAGSGEHVITTPLPGRYLLSCENHETERALLIIVGHPFFTLTGPNGRFDLRSVPAGEHVIVVLRNGHGPSRRAITIAPSTRTELTIEVN